jgi:hypothetical protein
MKILSIAILLVKLLKLTRYNDIKKYVS